MINHCSRDAGTAWGPHGALSSAPRGLLEPVIDILDPSANAQGPPTASGSPPTPAPKRTAPRRPPLQPGGLARQASHSPPVGSLSSRHPPCTPQSARAISQPPAGPTCWCQMSRQARALDGTSQQTTARRHTGLLPTESAWQEPVEQASTSQLTPVAMQALCATV